MPEALSSASVHSSLSRAPERLERGEGGATAAGDDWRAYLADPLGALTTGRHEPADWRAIAGTNDIADWQPNGGAD